jgi:cell division protein FtsB
MITNMSSAATLQASSNSTLKTPHSLSSRWQQRKETAGFPQRLGMRIIEITILAAAMFIIPTTIHRIVQSLDEVYELLGRRARSPYAQAVPWTSALVATVLLLGWHVWLGRLSYKTIIEDQQKTSESKKRVSWDRILGRIVIPLLLLSYGVHFAYQLFHRLANPAPLVTRNANDESELKAMR